MAATAATKGCLTAVIPKWRGMARPKLIAAAVRPFKALFVSDTFAGVLLIAVAVLAIVAVNTPLAALYHDVFHGVFAWTPIPKLDTLHAWISDAMMAVFFFVVGLEVKREIVDGELSDSRKLRLPVMAAFAGMAMPAAIYAAIAGGDTVLNRGWAIPAATDIAFAMGVVGLLGKTVPHALRLFLLTVAVVDDIGAVAIIALFYSADIALGWLFASLLVAAAMVLMNWRGADRIGVYALFAIVLWVCVLHSGIHATIAGVIAALTVPMRRRDGSPLLDIIEHRLAGWNAYLIVPLFGLANAGIDLKGFGLDRLLSPVPLAIAIGLILGKQLGIFGAVLLAEKFDIAARPAGAGWMQIWGISILCGIGFTMSLFIGAIGFAAFPSLYEQAKIGIVTGSLVSVLLGYAVLRFARPNGTA
jgi:NhaA family Na+:H+ antiporter